MEISSPTFGISVLFTALGFWLGMGQLAAGIVALILQARFLHEPIGNPRRRPRTISFYVLAIALCFSGFGTVYQTFRGAVLTAEAEDAERFARAAAHRVGVFAFKPGASQRIIAGARKIGVPNGPVSVIALASRDTSVTCGFLQSVLAAAGWSVTGDCVATAIYNGDNDPLSPALIVYAPSAQSTSAALATLLTSEGIETKIQAIPSNEMNRDTPPIGLVLRYL